MPRDSICLPGHSNPLGATVYPDGVNFSVFSKNCTQVELWLYETPDDPHPFRTIILDPVVNRTFYYWHVFVPRLKPGVLYNYRVLGPRDPHLGHRFDGNKLLIDPYSREIAFGRHFDRDAAIYPGANFTQAPRSVVVDTATYDWEGDEPLKLPFPRTIIYELHVGGFTRNPNSGLPDDHRGTYRGLIEKIPYLKSLGITAVELLPVQQFDPYDAPGDLPNYWGYSPMAFFAPHTQYASDRSPLGPTNEFRDMVKELHRAGIEVYLDVVFNHTAEGDEHGPTYSLRGFENRAYYMLQKDHSRYHNFTGCGNTINGYHSVVRRMITDCLKYWVTEMHVDGFRFDLASVLARDEKGNPLESPPLLWSIESDPALAGTKLIAEAWDAGGLYQVGSFVGHKWTEWNGRYRDDIRRFVRGDEHSAAPLALRIPGSSDLYSDEWAWYPAYRSINFITAHDGFTLNDLVSYNEKHNLANGEENRDGSNDNYSDNCGIEGPTEEASINARRLSRIKTFFTLLFLSQGTPMMLMGDEVRRTQAGNNNAYCQDNEISWFDWSALTREEGLLQFVRKLIHFVQSYELFEIDQFWNDPLHPLLTFHGVEQGRPDWRWCSHSLAYELQHEHNTTTPIHLFVMLNAYHESLAFELPALPADRCWSLIIDTSREAPADFSSPQQAYPVSPDRFLVQPYSTAVLMSRPCPHAAIDSLITYATA